MLTNHFKRYILIIIIINVLCIDDFTYIFAQDTTIDSLEINKSFSVKVDSINREMKRTVVLQRVKESGLDTIVDYKSLDSMVYNVKTHQMKLNNQAEINFKSQKLSAHQIIISFDKSEMTAESKTDSNKKMIGIPKFIDKGEEFYGQVIKFNFKSGKGVINLGETEVNDGFYFGEKIKRINEKEYYVGDGYFTTCDHPDPHFHFGSSKMKVITEDRVLLDPLVFYIEDLPIMVIPFGMFFPSSGGRQSGLILPTYSFSKFRGVVFQNLGFYWAASEYWDTQIKTDLYSKGGFMLKNTTRWNLKNNFNGNIDFEYGKTRNSVDDEFGTNWRFLLNHSHDFTPYDKLVVNLNFSSQNFNRNTLIGNNEFIKQSIRSSASYSKQFADRTSFSLAYERDQNIISDEFSQTANARYSIPSTKIFGKSLDLPKWMKDITFNYGVSANYRNTKTQNLQFEINPLDSTKTDTLKNFIYDHSQKIEHTPSINISPKLGYFTVRPYLNFGFNNYFRKLDKSFNSEDSTVSVDTTWGFFTEYTYGAGLNVSTYLYGMVDDNKPLLGILKPSDVGIKAFRHVYNPTIGWSVRPNQSSPDLGLYGSYFNEQLKQDVIYSRYELDGGGIASRRYSSSINYSDLHSFEIKVAQGDTLPDKNLELLKVNLNASYDLAKDSLNLSDLNMQFRSPALKFIDLNGSASFRFYDEQISRKFDTSTGKSYDVYTLTDNFLLANGKGIFRMTNFSINIGTSFNSSGIQMTESLPIDSANIIKDSVSYGERFTKRQFQNYREADIFGDNSPGYSTFTFPWSLRLSLYYAYGRPSVNPASKTQTIDFRVNGSIKLTDTWNMSFSGGYDFIRSSLTVPSINLIKDLHCWELIFNWIPTGGNAGFYLKIGIKSSQLQDLKFEKQNNPLLR